jgi:hypothetical protein
LINELLEIDTYSNYFSFSEDHIEKLIRPHMRTECEKDKYNFLPSESGKAFSKAQYDKRKPGLFEVETTKHK